MQDGYPWIWEVFNNTRWRIEHRWDPNYPGLRLAPNGQYLLAYLECSPSPCTRFALYDVFSGQRIRSGTIPFYVVAAQFSYDSQFLLLAVERYDNERRRWISSLQVLQLPSWQLLRQLELEDVALGRGFLLPEAMLSHPSRPEVFLGRRIWNWLTGEWVGEVSHIADADKSPLFSPDGRFLVVAGWDEISVWRLQDRTLHYRLRFPGEWVNNCLISPDGTLLAVELRNRDSYEQVALYRLEDGSLHRHLFTGDRYADTLRFSPDGSLLAVDLESQVHLYRTVDGTLQGVIADSGVPLVFSSDGRYLVTRTHVWQLPGLVPVFTFEWTEWVPDESTNRTRSAAFSRDGSWLAAGSIYDEYREDWNWELAGDFQLVRVGSWERVVYQRDSSAIAQLAFLPDGRHLIVGKDDSGGWVEGYHRDGSLHLWQLPGAVERVTPPRGKPLFILSPTSRYLFADLHSAISNPSYYSGSSTLILWRVHRGQVLQAREYRDSYTVAFSHDEQSVVFIFSHDEQLIAFKHADAVVVARNPLFTPYGDVNSDGCVDEGDLLAVLGAFGTTEVAPDVDGDGQVDDTDLLIVLFNFGTGC